jgi:hypothetical protein
MLCASALSLKPALVAPSRQFFLSVPLAVFNTQGCGYAKINPKPISWVDLDACNAAERADLFLYSDGSGLDQRLSDFPIGVQGGYPMIRQNTLRTQVSATPRVLDYLPHVRIAYRKVENKAPGIIAFSLAGGLGVPKRKLALALLILLALPTLALPQNDPLSPAYLPSVDTNSADYPSNIWITDTMQKVRQDSGSPGTQHWGTFYGTQNEFVDFQVHVQAGPSGIPALSITTSDFVNSRTGTHILTGSTNIIVYREAYMDITTLSDPNTQTDTFYNATGYYPDILIPTVDPYFNQTTNAWPFTVAAGKNQSAWIDILVPSAAPSGYYLGSITVTSGSTTLTTMPVILAVWQWPSSGYMPSTATLSSFTQMIFPGGCDQFYGSYSSCGPYPHSGTNPDGGVEFSVIDQAKMLLDHRYSAASPIYTTVSLQSPGTELVNNWGPLLNGTTGPYTNTILSGAKVTSASYQGSINSTSLQNWETLFSAHGWSSILFDYSCDEPPAGCTWGAIDTNATTLHGSTPPMPALVTTDISNATSNGVVSGIDWMVAIVNYLDPVGATLQRSSYNTWLAGSSGPTRRLWSYQSDNSENSAYPNYYIDGVPAANRAMEWMSFRNGVTGELYYTDGYCWVNTCGSGTSDPWTSVLYSQGNGDGTWLYPSTSGSTNHVTNPSGGTLTSPIYLPSIRLKHIRDGMQDYEYLNVLTNAGQGTLVQTEISSWITNSYTFETSGKGLQGARTALGASMHQLTYPVLLSPPTNLQATVQ